MLNTNNIKEWIRLDEERKSHESLIDDIKGKMSALEEVILENFATEGVQSFKMDGFNVSPQTLIFAVIVDGDKERAYQALRETGYGSYITETCNIKSLSTLVKDLIEEDGKLPDQFQGAITTFEKIRLRKRKKG